ncbi:hypothetical protein GCM10009611_25820 [Arthrobacter roseus]
MQIALADVALLARVQRPVVSMWRQRNAHSTMPFPSPIAMDAGSELFDADAVVTWLGETGRGKNPDAGNDVGAFVYAGELRSADAAAHFQGLTALLALRQLMGHPLSEHSGEELLDCADEHDPDDVFLFTEVEALGSRLGNAAAYADLLTEGAYGPVAAFEKLVGQRLRSGAREQSVSALIPVAISLVASAAVELAGHQEAPVFADATTGSSDLLLGIIAEAGEFAAPTMLTSAADDGDARLVRRRLQIHGVHYRAMTEDSDLFGEAVVVGHYPPPRSGPMSDEQILQEIEDVVLQLGPTQRGVLIGPASALADPAASAQAELLRSGVLRSGRLRAVVRLPRGLVKGKPRQSQALWVLGPAPEGVPIAERWTMSADLSGGVLTPDVVQDVVGDLGASLAGHSAIRAHAFRFARLVLTRALLASRGSLVAPAMSGRQAVAAGEVASGDAVVEADSLVAALNEPPPALTLPVLAGPGSGSGTLTQQTVDSVIAAGYLKYVPGNRLLPEDVRARVSGARLIGVAELVDDADPGSRRIDRLDLTAKYPGSRLTEPGDVVFCTSPQTAALVDAEGGAVVVYPARILRISEADPGGLLPAVLAADVEAAPHGVHWRRWRVRAVVEEQRGKLDGVLAGLRDETARTRERLRQLERLEDVMIDGVSSGSLMLEDRLDQTKGRR